MKKSARKKVEVKLDLSKKEAEYLSSLVEAQVTRLVTANEKELET